MFTDNYLNLRKALFMGSGNYQFFYHDGSAVYWDASSLYKLDFGSFMKFGRCRGLFNDSMAPGIYFGTGSTPAARTDRTLESLITSGLEITNPSSIVLTEDAGVYEYSSTFTIKNTSDADITISEVGAYTVFVTPSNAYYGPMLLERTVLDNPITIPAGKVKIFIYKLTFNQPS